MIDPPALRVGRAAPASAIDLRETVAAIAACVERSGGRVVAVRIDGAEAESRPDAPPRPSTAGDPSPPRIKTPERQP